METLRFGPVLEVRVGVLSDDKQPVCAIRFASGKAVEAAMAKALRGWLPVGDKHVRVRLVAPEAPLEHRSFVEQRHNTPALEAPKKRSGEGVGLGFPLV